MRLLIASAIAAAFATVSAPPAGQRTGNSDALEQAFVDNGRIRMDLSAGKYRIVGASENRIRLAWRVRYADDLRDVKARAVVRGSEATITTDGPTNGFHVDIELPMRADLRIRLTAGELGLEGVEGSKDISLHAGELDIDVGNPEDYHRVEASVWAGELHAEPFGRSKEGLFRSFDWNGKGKYRLNAHLKAGEMRFRSVTRERR
jgi:hypothetical protein